MATAGRKRVRVEVTEETLNRLLTRGQVCAADFRCLDCKSKKCLWQLCLKSCTARVMVDKQDRTVRSDFCRACYNFLEGD